MEPIVLPAGLSVSGELLHITFYSGAPMVRCLPQAGAETTALTAAAGMDR